MNFLNDKIDFLTIARRKCNGPYVKGKLRWTFYYIHLILVFITAEKQLQNLAKKKLFERQARKKHRRKLERNRRRSEKKAKLQVKVDKALQKMEERQRIRKERKRLLQLGENHAEGACGNTDDLNHVTVEIWSHFASVVCGNMENPNHVTSNVKFYPAGRNGLLSLQEYDLRLKS